MINVRKEPGHAPWRHDPHRVRAAAGVADTAAHRVRATLAAALTSPAATIAWATVRAADARGGKAAPDQS